MAKGRYLVTVLIGNSDDKLSQKDWSAFYSSVRDTITDLSVQMQFSGGSHCNAPWQNACFVANLSGITSLSELREKLKVIREKYQQDSVVVACTHTDEVEFV